MIFNTGVITDKQIYDRLLKSHSIFNNVRFQQSSIIPVNYSANIAEYYPIKIQRSET
jgi:hypothetical protein